MANDFNKTFSNHAPLILSITSLIAAQGYSMPLNDKARGAVFAEWPDNRNGDIEEAIKYIEDKKPTLPVI